MNNQLPSKKELLEMLEGSTNSLKEIERLIKLAELKEDFSGVANLFQIKLGLENVIYQINNQFKQLEALEKQQEELAQVQAELAKQEEVANGNDQQSQN